MTFHFEELLVYTKQNQLDDTKYLNQFISKTVNRPTHRDMEMKTSRCFSFPVLYFARYFNL